jgi:hypothetical protein
MKLNYVCKLLIKNLLCNMGYFVSYLIRHKKFITSSMFKYTKIGYPTNKLTLVSLLMFLTLGFSPSQPR